MTACVARSRRKHDRQNEIGSNMMMDLNSEISTLYHRLLECWNDRDPAGYASLFTENATVFGFDGSQMKGPKEIEETLNKIFADHETGR
jgi:uncharacterized protein (TIGR02246 family)